MSAVVAARGFIVRGHPAYYFNGRTVESTWALCGPHSSCKLCRCTLPFLLLSL